MLPIRVEVTRRDSVESAHEVHAVVLDARGRIVESWGDAELSVYWRSSAKPLQAIPVVETGAARHCKLTPAELALCCASHNGAELHVATARSILRKAGVSPEWLQCRTHQECAESTFRCSGPSDSLDDTLRHNCSGKHSGMLTTAQFRGEPLADYREPTHPVQQRVLAAVSSFSEVPRGQLEATVVPDGCGAPIFATPLRSLALAYAKFGIGATDSARTLRDAMTAHPEMVAGPGAFNTVLMQQLGDLLVCKSGAEGVFGLGLRTGTGVAMKVMDGNHRATAVAALAILRNLQLVPLDRLAPLHELAEPAMRNGHQVAVGMMRAKV